MQGLPKYCVSRSNVKGRLLWVVTKKGQPLKSFEYKDAADEYAQQLVEDDRWHASNR